jgi:hypothetical protein
MGQTANGGTSMDTAATVPAKPPLGPLAVVKADAPDARGTRSGFHLFSLDAVNFLAADVRGAAGPYLNVFLVTQQHWSQSQAGLVTMIGGLCGIAVQTPSKPIISRIMRLPSTRSRSCFCAWQGRGLSRAGQVCRRQLPSLKCRTRPLVLLRQFLRLSGASWCRRKRLSACMRSRLAGTSTCSKISISLGPKRKNRLTTKTRDLLAGWEVIRKISLRRSFQNGTGP